jgi:hypothetical protein
VFDTFATLDLLQNLTFLLLSVGRDQQQDCATNLTRPEQPKIFSAPYSNW